MGSEEEEVSWAGMEGFAEEGSPTGWQQGKQKSNGGHGWGPALLGEAYFASVVKVNINKFGCF